MYKKGFTLAEVLITLSIIGVVAALTIPSLTREFQETQFRNSFKKMYSDLAQATLMVKADNGDTLVGFYSDPIGSEVMSDDIRNKYIAHMNYVKKCNESGATDCWHAANQWYELNGTPRSGTNASKVVLKSGAFIVFNTVSQSCAGQRGASLFDVCADMWVDVNGYKAPNTMGKDIFMVYITDKGLVPRGAQGDWWSCNPSGNGWGCAAAVLQNIDY